MLITSIISRARWQGSDASLHPRQACAAKQASMKQLIDQAAGVPNRWPVIPQVIGVEAFQALIHKVQDMDEECPALIAIRETGFGSNMGSSFLEGTYLGLVSRETKRETHHFGGPPQKARHPL